VVTTIKIKDFKDFLLEISMADSVSCPGCHRLLQVPEAQRGREVQCPSCGRIFVSEQSTGITELPNAPVRPNPVAVQAGPPMASLRERRYSLDEDDDDMMALAAPPRNNFRSSGSLALVVKVLLGLNAALAFVMLVFDYLQYGLVARQIKGDVIPGAEIDSNDLRQQRLELMYLLLFVCTAVVFLVWFYRVHANLTALGAGPLKYTSGWAVGCWFVPILCFFLDLCRSHKKSGAAAILMRSAVMTSTGGNRETQPS
jgi:hypothetical protein